MDTLIGAILEHYYLGLITKTQAIHAIKALNMRMELAA